MTDDLRTILDRVAAGTLTPEQAQELLAETAPPPTPDPTAPPEAGSGAASEPSDAGQAVARIQVRGSAVKLTIVGDPEVATAVAEGPHRVEQIGDQLVIRSDLSDDGGATEPPRSAFTRWLEAGTRAGSTLTVRVNQFLPLEVLAVAGSLELQGMRAPVSVGIEAGSAKVGPGSGPLQLSVSSGAAEVDWLFVGKSTVTAELGSAKVNVLQGSDVVITAESSAGSASLISADGTSRAPASGTTASLTAGAGTGTLTARSRLGSVVVRVV
ncbi:MAG: hypothetical protein QG597_78 [Actinomycetota bacterium]|nr:hypothetical protein [Actinomycetota bacterium]